MIKNDSSTTHATHTYLYIYHTVPLMLPVISGISQSIFCMISVVVACVGCHKSAMWAARNLTRFCSKSNHTAK